MSLGGAVVRKAGATYFLPTVDEWYKAAYFDPNKPGGAGYWDYPTQSDTPPNNNAPSSDTGNSANFSAASYTIGPPYCSTPVGAYSQSDSAYGTFDQGGNILEWTESALGEERMTRGGAYSWSYAALHARWKKGWDASREVRDIGFRVARLVPEPGSVALLGIGGAALGLVVARRRRSL
jgi:formylglycine-generating enzyme required for sulfatase activity